MGMIKLQCTSVDNMQRKQTMYNQINGIAIARNKSGGFDFYVILMLVVILTSSCICSSSKKKTNEAAQRHKCTSQYCLLMALCSLKCVSDCI